tara:strand:+ start:1783 stop:2544 length:762 start_codon:yes stop_codon:yes gene_type:complete
MQKPRLDGNGVPILSHEGIELRTEKLLEVLAPTCLSEIVGTPIAAIAEKLSRERGLIIVPQASLGSIGGRKIRGCCDINSGTVYVDDCLEPGSAKFNFTLAHEIGHFLMHRNVLPSALNAESDPLIKDIDRDLVFNQLESDNPRSLIEWQANKFASSILLPRKIFPKAVIFVQKELGVSRNIGKVYLNARNDPDYKNLVDALSLIYRVSSSVLRIRMQELNILVDKTSFFRQESAVKTANEALTDLFNSWGLE